MYFPSKYHLLQQGVPARGDSSLACAQRFRDLDTGDCGLPTTIVIAAVSLAAVGAFQDIFRVGTWGG